MRNNFAFKIILIALISFYFSANCFAQDYPANDSVVNKFVIKLQNQGIDSILTYQSYFPGAFIIRKPGMDTTCIHTDRANVYFLWKYKGVSYITLQNECADYSPININADKLWQFYVRNETKIDSEKIKPFEIIELLNGKREVFPVLVDHSSREDVMIIIGKKYIKQHFDGHDFEKATSGKQLNINYQYNMTAKSTKLEEILRDIVREVSNKKLLKKIVQ